MEELCNEFEKTNFIWKPNKILVNDISLFIKELQYYINDIVEYAEIDIYHILMESGSEVSFSLEYFITEEDLKWFRNAGKVDFFKYIHDTVIPIDNYNLYYYFDKIHNQLLELFQLMVN